jgi:hypothetical protein
MGLIWIGQTFSRLFLIFFLSLFFRELETLLCAKIHQPAGQLKLFRAVMTDWVHSIYRLKSNLSHLRSILGFKRANHWIFRDVG